MHRIRFTDVTYSKFWSLALIRFFQVVEAAKAVLVLVLLCDVGRNKRSAVLAITLNSVGLPELRFACSGLRRFLKCSKAWTPVLCGFILLATTHAASAQEVASKDELYTGREFVSAFANPKDDPDLPNVLLIGDSISIGYTVDVRKRLAGQADVFRIPTNGRFASYGLGNLDKWLGKRNWDVIHFNWGLWDICYRNPKSKTQGHRDKAHGKLTASPDQYRMSLEQSVTCLMKTDATLIWCATTPVPESEVGRKVGDEIKYNSIAESIMKKNEIRIDDLHAHALLKLPEIQKGIGDVHFTKQGYEHLAKKVALEISSVLSAEGSGENHYSGR